VMAPLPGEKKSAAPMPSVPSDHFGSSRSRRTIIWALLCVILVGCSGYQLLLELGATADQYFNSFEFQLDVLQAADFAGKVLGSGGI
jgi:hypothetical protein